MATDKLIIMIVDDDPDDRFFFAEAIRKMDAYYECVQVDTGQKALQHLKLAIELPGYLFLDLNMPQMDGREVLRQLKKDERLRHLPVIIYSSSSYEADIEETLSLGAAHYLPKPFSISRLPEEISEAIRCVEQN